jgi:uncharacterized protein YabN with tetrapyrrole methylase and pyrophosphatase domain
MQHENTSEIAWRRAQTWAPARHPHVSTDAHATYDDIADVVEWHSLRRWEHENGSIVIMLTEFGKVLIQVWHILGWA